MTTALLDHQPRTDAEFARIVAELTRRGFLAGGLGAATLGLAACGSSGGSVADAGPTGAGGWSFTDASGRRIGLEKLPSRLVVTSGVLESLWDFGVRPVGCLGQKPTGAAVKTSLTRVDLSTITFCGGGDGVDAEKVLALRPDLVLAEWDAPSKSYWGFGNSQNTAATVNKVCPVGGVDITGTAPQLLARMRELAVLLGAAAQGTDVRTAVSRFTTARDTLKRAIAGKPGLRVALMGGDNTGVSFGNPKGMTDLAYYQQLGLRLVTGPQGSNIAAATTNYWSDTISWENIGDYPLDLLLLTANSDVSVYEQVATYRRLPAVRAGQVGYYPQLPSPSYLTYAADMRYVADLLGTAERVA